METTDQLAAELRKLRSAVTDLAQDVKSAGYRHVDRVGDGIEETSRDVLRNSRRLTEDLERRLGELEKSVSRTVRDHPKTVIGGGVLGVILVGLLLSVLFRRDH